MTVVQQFEERYPGTRIGPLIMWAVWAVEAVNYLVDHDQVQSAYPNPVLGHDPDVVDIAHVRWATGSTITALDLCAAALGIHYCGNPGPNELDLKDFYIYKRTPRGILRKIRKRIPKNCYSWFDRLFRDKRTRQIEARRSKLPARHLDWVDGVLADAGYKKIHGARNRFTHAWLSRSLSCGGAVGHAGRTRFRLKKSQETINARDLIELSAKLATEQVQEFLNILDET